MLQNTAVSAFSSGTLGAAGSVIGSSESGTPRVKATHTKASGSSSMPGWNSANAARSSSRRSRSWSIESIGWTFSSTATRCNRLAGVSQSKRRISINEGVINTRRRASRHASRAAAGGSASAPASPVASSRAAARSSIRKRTPPGAAHSSSRIGSTGMRIARWASRSRSRRTCWSALVGVELPRAARSARWAAPGRARWANAVSRLGRADGTSSAHIVTSSAAIRRRSDSSGASVSRANTR